MTSDFKPSWLEGNLPSSQVTKERSIKRVLFFCTANICRSAFAEQLMKNTAMDLPIEVDSAGIYALIGHGMDPMMMDELDARGVTPQPHEAKQLTGRLLGQSDLLVTFERDHVLWALSENPSARSRLVLVGQLERYLQQLPHPESLENIALNASRLPVEDSDPLDDPFGRGTNRIANAANRIDNTITMLSAILRAYNDRGATDRS